MKREKLREIIFLLLFAWDFREESFDEEEKKDLKSLIIETLKLKTSFPPSVWERLKELEGDLEDIDEKISLASREYTFERIQRVEKNLLRLLTYELKHHKIEPAIAIAEALRLTKKFSTREGAKFVHAVLDSVCKQGL